ncbi:hypothetical protein F5876DRAFT_81467 [Lentinula aff. lateritia]|uniref:Uncharacterized protein n=1 Tax=Lentinula aff. lateritia TaxID=2804960 RepID=A0ACC1TLU5_9AGAR|nr:hypothetical protein F5876DRAFT_81467 [Lentinula aff. lateritia]
MPAKPVSALLKFSTLVDSGFTDSFIDTCFVSQNSIPTSKIPPVNLCLFDGSLSAKPITDMANIAIRFPSVLLPPPYQLSSIEKFSIPPYKSNRNHLSLSLHLFLDKMEIPPRVTQARARVIHPDEDLPEAHHSTSLCHSILGPPPGDPLTGPPSASVGADAPATPPPTQSQPFVQLA